MKRMGVAIVGLGPGSQPHLASLSALADQAELLWGVCRDPGKASLQGTAGLPPLTSDLAAVLADPAVEMVIVATPASTHLEIAGAALKAGKHTLVEKPLEVTLGKAEQLVALARESDARFGVVLQHRFKPGSVRLKEIVDSGRLGDIQAASVRVPWWRPQKGYYDQPGRGTRARDGGGVLLTQAIHTLDLFRALVGVSGVDAVQVRTTALHRMETEDYVSALLRLGNAAPGSLMATTAMMPGFPDSIEILGSEGTAVLTGGDLVATFLDGTEERLQSDGRSGGGANIMDFSPQAHQALIADFIDAARTGREPLVSGHEALETHRLIEQILAMGGAGSPG